MRVYKGNPLCKLAVASISRVREPWRKKTEKATEIRYVENFKPSSDTVKHVRILLHGLAGSGKSSFINSVNSVLEGIMTSDALVDSHFGESFTKKYKTHKFEKGKPGNYYPFVFNDTMGLEKCAGVHQRDIDLALKGHVKEGYKLNPSSPLSEEDPAYNRSPTLDDKVHILVCVMPADVIARMEDEVIAKIRKIRLAASDLGLPQIAILTKIDLACPLVRENQSNVYKSKLLKEKMLELSQKVGIPMNCIFPVENYHEQTAFDEDMDMLILQALRHMLDFGNNFVKKHADPLQFNRI